MTRKSVQTTNKGVEDACTDEMAMVEVALGSDCAWGLQKCLFSFT